MANDPLRLTVLGSATPYLDADNPCSGYLVSGGGARLWMDAGSGTLGPLQRHVGRSVGPAAAVARAASRFAGPVGHADPGDVVPVG